MRRVIICLMLLVFASSSYAEIQEFKYFSVDIPDDWSFQEDGSEVKITADNETGALTIITDEPEGNSIEDLASLFAIKFGGSEIVSDDEGNFTFEFDEGEGQATITGDEDFYILIMASGFEENGDTLGEILNSLEMK